GLGIVVRAALEVSGTTLVANTLACRLLVRAVVDRATLGAGITTGHATNEFLVIDAQFDDRGEIQALVLQHPLGRVRLDQRPRKAIENETVGTVGLVDSLRHDGDDDIVGYQLA